jgi:uncharacterized membrane protein YjjB (DUF3815 family)
MFQSSTIIKKLALNLAKVIFTLKHLVKLRRYLLCSFVAACCLLAAIFCFKGILESLKLPIALQSMTDSYKQQWFIAMYV